MITIASRKLGIGMSTASSEPKLEGLDYRVVGVLGNGAGSTILRIVNKHLGRDFALKVVKRQDQEDDIYVSQVLHEFEVAQKLDHRTILKIFDCRTKRSWFKITGVELLMEFVEGRTLDDAPRPELGQIVLIFSEIASGLRLMHRRGVFHGDLKPSNIMLSTEGEVKILNFGTAWIKGQPKNRVQGTPQYMAPEQAADKIVNEKNRSLQLRRNLVPSPHRRIRQLRRPDTDQHQRRRPRDFEAQGADRIQSVDPRHAERVGHGVS